VKIIITKRHTNRPAAHISEAPWKLTVPHACPAATEYLAIHVPKNIFKKMKMKISWKKGGKKKVARFSGPIIEISRTYFFMFCVIITVFFTNFFFRKCYASANAKFPFWKCYGHKFFPLLYERCALTTQV
jgi:hypothetical protein